MALNIQYNSVLLCFYFPKSQAGGRLADGGLGDLSLLGGQFQAQSSPTVPIMSLSWALWTETKTKTDRKVTQGNDQCWSEPLLPPALLVDTEVVSYWTNWGLRSFTVWDCSSDLYVM